MSQKTPEPTKKKKKSFEDKVNKSRAKVAKKYIFLSFGPNMTLVMFIWNMDLFKIVFLKDTFEREKCLFERQLLTKSWSESVFQKDDFYV